MQARREPIKKAIAKHNEDTQEGFLKVRQHIGGVEEGLGAPKYVKNTDSGVVHTLWLDVEAVGNNVRTKCNWKLLKANASTFLCHNDATEARYCCDMCMKVALKA